TVDGEYQACKAFGGAYTREKFFGKYPETAALVANMSDDDIWRLNRGGHDPHKVYAAYHAAVNTRGMPTVVLAKTVKGYGMGAAGESQNPAHNQKKMDTDAIRAFRDRFNIPIPDDKLDEVPYYHPGKDSEEVQYMLERRRALGGSLPQRRRKSDQSFKAPTIESFEQITKGMPTVVLAKTVKGYGMGAAGESQNPAHNQKKMDTESIRAFRDRFNIPIPDDKLDEVPYYHPGKDSEEVQYMLERRRALGGSLPQRRRKSEQSFKAPAIEAFEQITKGTGDREISTTMALVRGMNLMLRDKELGPRIVPIVADEARTFGMEGMFRQIGIYAPFGQKYRPQDADQLLYYREDQKGQVLQEGISEAGGMSAWLAAATSYSISNVPMLPFFIYYSMFGFQRIGDLCWAAGDMRARGFLIGGTSGRTTLNGEGLQHEDGHSHLLSGAIPNVVSYDPTFSYELAVIMQDGTRRMMQEQEDVYYYITVMNENYAHPDLPKGSEEGIVKGMYLFKDGGKAKKNEPRVQLMGSGTILREVIAAAELLEKDFGVSSDIWSVPSFSEVRREGFDAERWNRLHPEAPQRVPYITGLLADRQGPAIAATDYVREFADQVRAFMPDGMRYTVLGTDGYGRSDTRAHLRSHFEVDRYWIAQAALAALAKDGKVNAKDVSRAIKEYKLDMDKPNPMTV
ncbi:MAG: hypothetical protein ABW193_12670, partial [Luteibacter sp.]